MANQTNCNQRMLDLFLKADALIADVLSQEDVRKLRELLATGLVKVHVECVIDEHGASEAIGRISQPGRKTGTLFHLAMRNEPEEKTIIEPCGFTHEDNRHAEP